MYPSMEGWLSCAQLTCLLGKRDILFGLDLPGWRSRRVGVVYGDLHLDRSEDLQETEGVVVEGGGRRMKRMVRMKLVVCSGAGS